MLPEHPEHVINALCRRLARYLFKAKTLAYSCLVHIDKPFPDGYQSIMGMYYA